MGKVLLEGKSQEIVESAVELLPILNETLFNYGSLGLIKGGCEALDKYINNEKICLNIIKVAFRKPKEVSKFFYQINYHLLPFIHN